MLTDLFNVDIKDIEKAPTCTSALCDAALMERTTQRPLTPLSSALFYNYLLIQHPGVNWDLQPPSLCDSSREVGEKERAGAEEGRCHAPAFTPCWAW